MGSLSGPRLPVADNAEMIDPDLDEGERHARERAADPRHRPALRRCLGCNVRFVSAHAGNRICKACSNTVASLRSAMA